MSVREISATYNSHFFTADNLRISAVVENAVDKFYNDGKVPGTKGHKCSECVHAYIPPSSVNDDSAATLGIDLSNSAPPAFEGQVDHTIPNVSAQPEPNANATVTMDVIDGMVMGPLHCAYDEGRMAARLSGQVFSVRILAMLC